MPPAEKQKTSDTLIPAQRFLRSRQSILRLFVKIPFPFPRAIEKDKQKAIAFHSSFSAPRTAAALLQFAG